MIINISNESVPHRTYCEDAMKNLIATFIIFLSSFNYAFASLDPCENDFLGTVVQLDIKFRFEDDRFNSEEFFRSLSPRIYGEYTADNQRVLLSSTLYNGSLSDGSWPARSTVFGDVMTARFCLNLGSLSFPFSRGNGANTIISKGAFEKVEFPEKFTFRYGPKPIVFEVPQLKTKLQNIDSQRSFADQKNQKPGEAQNLVIAKDPVVVIKEPIVFEPADDPDWLWIQDAWLTRVSNNITALELNFLNYSQRRASVQQLSINASKSLKHLCGGSRPPEFTKIEFRELEQNSASGSSKFPFGAQDIQPVVLHGGLCFGQLEALIQPINLPSVAAQKESTITYQFGTFVDGDQKTKAFWSLFDTGRLEFTGKNIWPKSVYPRWRQ